MEPGIALLHQIPEGGDVRIQPVAQSVADLGHEARAFLAGLEEKARGDGRDGMVGRHRGTPFCGLLSFFAASLVPGYDSVAKRGNSGAGWIGAEGSDQREEEKN